MPKKSSGIILPVFEVQTDATKTQANPTDATYYTILDTITNVRIKSIAVQGTFSANSGLEIKVTIDGETYNFAATNLATVTDYYPKLTSKAGSAGTVSSTDYAPSAAFLFEGRSVKVEFRWNQQAAETCSQIVGRVAYTRVT